MVWMVQGHPREVQLLHSKSFGCFHISTKIFQFCGISRTFILEHAGVNRILLQVGTLTVPSLCPILCVWYIQKLFCDHELRHMWCFSCTELCFGGVVICSRSRAVCWSCLRKVQLPKSSTAGPQMHITKWCILVIHTSSFILLHFSLHWDFLKSSVGFSGM